MEQQTWKKELDANAQREKGAEGTKARPKRKSKAKGKAKAKARAKTDKDQVKTEKGEKKKGRTVKKRPSKEAVGEEHPEEEAEPKVKVARKPRKAKQDVAAAAAEPELKTPQRANPPKAPSPSASKRKAPAKASKHGGDAKTFARRYKPTTSWGAGKWEALRSVFTSIIAVRVNGPLSKLEAIGFLLKKTRVQ